MGIIESVSEIDRLYGVHDEAEQKHFEAHKQIQRMQSICEGAMDRIDVIFDRVAAAVPETIEEAFALAVALRSQMPAGDLEEESDTRQRIDRMIDNLMLGLKQLCTSHLTIPHWFDEHISGAENGCAPINADNCKSDQQQRWARS